MSSPESGFYHGQRLEDGSRFVNNHVENRRDFYTGDTVKIEGPQRLTADITYTGTEHGTYLPPKHLDNVSESGDHSFVPWRADLPSQKHEATAEEIYGGAEYRFGDKPKMDMGGRAVQTEVFIPYEILKQLDGL